MTASSLTQVAEDFDGIQEPGTVDRKKK